MADYIEKINGYTIGGPNFAGQWVNKLLTVFNGFPTQNQKVTVDLSSYLPDKVYNYEVLVAGYAYTGDTNGNGYQLKVNAGNSISQDSALNLCTCNTRTNAFTEAGGSGELFIPTDNQYISIFFYGNCRQKDNASQVKLLGYRRVGRFGGAPSLRMNKIQLPSGTSIPIGGNNFDGQWINGNNKLIWETTAYTANQNVSVNLKTSGFLPNDKYAYEVIISAWATTGASAGRYALVRIVNTGIITNWYNMCGAKTQTSSTETAGGCTKVPISAAGVLTFSIGAPEGVTEQAKLWFHAYRRLGTNT